MSPLDEYGPDALTSIGDLVGSTAAHPETLAEVRHQLGLPGDHGPQRPPRHPGTRELAEGLGLRD